jgi:hypothetical protein
MGKDKIDQSSSGESQADEQAGRCGIPRSILLMLVWEGVMGVMWFICAIHFVGLALESGPAGLLTWACLFGCSLATLACAWLVWDGIRAVRKKICRPCPNTDCCRLLVRKKQ